MDVHTAAGLADSDFGSKGDGDAVAVSQRAHNPFGYDQLVGGILKIGRQKLNLVLLVHRVAHGEIAHLAVAVFDKSSALGNKFHSLGAVVLELAERTRLVVAALVGGQIVLLLRSDSIVFQLAHNLKLHTVGSLAEGLASLVQRILGCHLEGLAVLGVEVAQDVERRYLGKGVDECRAEARNDIEVRASSLEEGEQARAVDTLA